MNNPFDVIDARLTSIENLILTLKHPPKESGQRKETNRPEQFLTVQDAAEFLHLTVPTIYSKVSRGDLPAMKRGNRLYFSRQELLEYLKEGRKKTNAEIEAEAHTYLKSKK